MSTVIAVDALVSRQPPLNSKPSTMDVIGESVFCLKSPPTYVVGRRLRARRVGQRRQHRFRDAHELVVIAPGRGENNSRSGKVFLHKLTKRIPGDVTQIPIRATSACPNPPSYAVACVASINNACGFSCNSFTSSFKFFTTSSTS